MKGRYILAGLLTVATSSVSVAQGNLVNWGWGATNYVNASTDLNRKNADISGLLAGSNFSLTSPDTLSPTSGYSGTSFYGGAVTQTLATSAHAAWDRFRIQDQGSGDMFDFQITQHSAQDAHNMALAIVWNKADFLNSTNFITFDANSQFRIQLEHVDSSMTNGTGYWLVQNGSTLYLSQATFSPTNGTYTYNPYVNASSDGNWAVYNPSGLNMNFDQSAANFQDQQFADITAVGFYIEHDSFRDNFNFSIQGFSVSAAVPEPASLFLLGTVVLGAAGYQFKRYRRTRQKANQPV